MDVPEQASGRSRSNLLILIIIAVGACDGRRLSNADAASPACGAATDAGPCRPCAIDVTDLSLPDTRVHIEGDRCRVETGRPHIFRYRIDVGTPMTYIAPDSMGSCGRCAGYTADPLTLVDTSVGDGAEVLYCECDEGCCLPTVSQQITLSPGVSSGEIHWPGYQWRGSSDTGNPLGPKFPAGEYFVEVFLRVPGVGAIDAKLPITVVAPP